MNKELAKKKVFVTGATGYVGQNLVFSLTKKDYEIYILTRKEKTVFSDLKNVHIVLGDINDDISLPEGISTIYHCAGVIYDKEHMEQVNVQGTKNIVNIAIQNDCELVYLSSAGIIGMSKDLILNENTICIPQNHYELSKYKAEQAVKNAVEQGLKANILRPTTIFGAGQDNKKDIFLQLAQSMRTGLYKNIGNGILNIVHINEVVSAMELLGETHKNFGEVYIINNFIPYKEMDILVKDLNPKIQKKTTKVPYPIAFIGTMVLTVFFFFIKKKNPLTFSRLKALTERRIYSQEKITKKLGFKNKHSLEEYIKEVCTDYIKLGLIP